MAWCPKCKLEYRDGITVCADCNTPLVDQLEEENTKKDVMSCDDKEMTERFLGFLSYSGITSGEITENEEELNYTVSVDEKDVKEAKKLFRAFYLTEVEEASQTEKVEKIEQAEKVDEDSLDEADENDIEEAIFDVEDDDESTSGVYVKRKDRYADNIATAKMFYVFGAIGLIFVLLNVVGVLKLVGGFTLIVYTVLFAGCLVVGFTTQKSAMKLKGQIKEEEDATAAINQWMKENITLESLENIDQDASEEVLYLERTARIKELVSNQFGALDDAFIDQLIEDFYNENF